MDWEGSRTARRILVVAPGPTSFLEGRLGAWEVRVSVTAWDATVRLAHEPFAVLLVDDALAAPHDGVWLLRLAHACTPDVVRWMMGRRCRPDLDELLARGVVEQFLRQPFDLGDLLARFT